jgi:hypothetical protein
VEELVAVDELAAHVPPDADPAHVERLKVDDEDLHLGEVEVDGICKFICWG